MPGSENANTITRLMMQVCDLQQAEGCRTIEVQRLTRENERITRELERHHLKGKLRHSCLEWDGLVIDASCPEFEACICFNEFITVPR